MLWFSYRSYKLSLVKGREVEGFWFLYYKVVCCSVWLVILYAMYQNALLLQNAV